MTVQHVKWTGLLPWTICAAATVVGAWQAIRRKSALACHAALLAGLALAVTAYYCSQTQTFGRAPFKYAYVCWGLALLSPALFSLVVWRDANLFRRARWDVAGAVFVVAVAYGARWLHDDLIYGRDNATGQFIWSVPAYIALGAILVWWRWPETSRRFLGLAVVMYAGLSLGIAINQGRTPYSTQYDYGQLGMEDTVGFIRANTAENDLVVSMKDIGLETGRRCFENYQPLYGDTAVAARVKGAISEGKVAYAIFTYAHGQDQLAVNPDLQRWIEANTVLVRSFGDYRVYQPISRNSGPGIPNPK